LWRELHSSRLPAGLRLPNMISSPVAGLIDWLGRREEEEARIPMRAGWVGQGCMHQACDPVCLDSDELNWDGQ
jgi:hypothetical protein